MARIRTIKPEFWQDEKLSLCDPLTRLVFLGLVSLADDCGRIVDNLRYIDAQLFMNTSDSALEPLRRLSGMGRINRGCTASGQPIIEIANWKRHQRISHPNLKGSLPQIVAAQEVAEIPESFRNHSGAIPEPLRHHTNDQRPTTNDQRPPISSAPAAVDRVRDAPEPLGPAAPDTPARIKRVRKPVEKPVLWPDWPTAERNRLFELWRSTLGEVRFPQWIAAVGPVFGRPPDGVRYADLANGYAGWLRSVAFGGNATRFASPESCAKILTAAAIVARDVQDPEARGKAFDLIAHGRVAA